MGIIVDASKELERRKNITDFYTSNDIKPISKISRTCFNCKLNTVCFAYKELKEVLAKLPVNIHGDEAPLNSIGVFDSLAGCCLMYEENK